MTNRTQAGIVPLMLAQGLAVIACGDQKFATPLVTAPTTRPTLPGRWMLS